ncbi:TetR family transcriptional regulator [Thermosporothrix hazakensis]|uniref:TetR family transcriptional regulator n=3 Tax=Thermosporothrix TaxID=768650 RepID=A0A326UE46_THEHA|nr:TetR/AcrR family transcriptional regulator [Thermosporothrix hazakensis]PZW28045.1 TetR family transcriptional regulator [Thermosporothrix hazakensis]BBH86977.1 TetR family transcriptional regulator [Thermosporothrix sp. COM3]GCE51267.1 TetR family transcriptional regulator [Thermosporothrix hazakensis]
MEYSGKGDPQRSIELLWGKRKSPSRGPVPNLSVERIVQTAIALADAEGLTALSMRRVAERLGVGVMSLYTYVPGKAELLDVMLDTAIGEEKLPTSIEGTWRPRLELRAREDWQLYQRHPWMLQVSTVRSLLGPNETMLYEATLQAIRDTGLTGKERISVVDLIIGYVRGAAKGAIEAALAAQQTGQDDAQWWQEREPLLDQFFSPERFPAITEIAHEGAFYPSGDADTYYLQWAIDDFEFGLQRVLDGIEAFIQKRQESVH